MRIEPANLVRFGPDTLERLLRAYRQVDCRDLAKAWHRLEVLHVLGQIQLGPHAHTHGHMFSTAWRM